MLNSSFKDQWRITVEFPAIIHHLQSGCFLFIPLQILASLFFTPVSLDSSYVQYFGNSYLEFGAVELTAVNHITVSFHTAAARGTLLYVDQGPANVHFFMKLFVMDGLLQVQVNIFVTATASSHFKLTLSCYSMPSAATRRRGLHRSEHLSLLMTARLTSLTSGIISCKHVHPCSGSVSGSLTSKERQIFNPHTIN